MEALATEVENLLAAQEMASSLSIIHSEP